MTTIIGQAESGEATVAMASIGIVEDERPLEESPLVVPLQKRIKHE